MSPLEFSIDTTFVTAFITTMVNGWLYIIYRSFKKMEKRTYLKFVLKDDLLTNIHKIRSVIKNDLSRSVNISFWDENKFAFSELSTKEFTSYSKFIRSIKIFNELPANEEKLKEGEKLIDQAYTLLTKTLSTPPPRQ